jgi:PKD repeat protein
MKRIGKFLCFFVFLNILLGCSKDQFEFNELYLVVQSGGEVVVSYGNKKEHCREKCAYLIPSNSNVSLAVHNLSSSIFDKWEGSSLCSLNSECSFVFNKDLKISANFIPNQFSINITVDKDQGIINNPIQFGYTSESEFDSWEWDFENDGIIDSTEDKPIHIYKETGNYSVQIIAYKAGRKFTKITESLVVITEPTARVYNIGPDKEYYSTHEVPLHKLNAGDVVRIFAREDRAAYYEKLYITGTGTKFKPILVIGISDKYGNPPIFDGENASANNMYGKYLWNEDRQIILIGQYGRQKAEHIYVENIEVRNAIKNVPFIGTIKPMKYLNNAAGIRVGFASAITLNKIISYNNENGLFASHYDSITLKNSKIYNNGVSKYSTQAHNIYFDNIKGSVAIVEFNYIGELLNDGQQFKSRAETLIFRYNWVEGGKNSILDLVESPKSRISNAYVYGNTLIKKDPVNNYRIIHFGGDNSKVPRSGTLYFYNNSIYSNTDKSYLFQLDEKNIKLIAYNNSFHFKFSIPSAGELISDKYPKVGKRFRISGMNNLFLDGHDNIINSVQTEFNLFNSLNHEAFIKTKTLYPVLFQYNEDRGGEVRLDQGQGIGASYDGRLD